MNLLSITLLEILLICSSLTAVKSPLTSGIISLTALKILLNSVSVHSSSVKVTNSRLSSVLIDEITNCNTFVRLRLNNLDLDKCVTILSISSSLSSAKAFCAPPSVKIFISTNIFATFKRLDNSSCVQPLPAAISSSVNVWKVNPLSTLSSPI